LCDDPISGFERHRLNRRINSKHYKRAWKLTKDREFARETGRKAWSQWVEAIAGRRTAVTRAAAPAVKKKKKMPVVTASRKKPVKQTAPQRVAEPNPKISATQERDDDADEEADAVSNDADD
jgi:hypothetical protein